jgi:hypothetical protein
MVWSKGGREVEAVKDRPTEERPEAVPAGHVPEKFAPLGVD